MRIIYHCFAGCGVGVCRHGHRAGRRTEELDANVFDGQHEALATGMSVLVEGNKITRSARRLETPAGATVIGAHHHKNTVN